MNGVVTLADLRPGVRVRHLESEITGMILSAARDTRVLQWDESFLEETVSPDGPLFPSDLMVIEDAA